MSPDASFRYAPTLRYHQSLSNPHVMSESEPTQRFSDRVADYVRYRPSYPEALLDLLESECGMRTDTQVADVGSGTGILTRLLLERGCSVFAIEPNAAMRQAAAKALAEHSGFNSISASAEATTLPNDSVDLITSAQAFHWFDPVATRAEFGRILKDDGFAAIIWNERRKQGSPFAVRYEQLLLEHSTDYRSIDHTLIGAETLGPFFGPAGYRQATFDLTQHFDFEGLLGRVLSSSYAPNREDTGFPAMEAALRSLFDAHQRDNRVQFDYDCRVYYGLLS